MGDGDDDGNDVDVTVTVRVRMTVRVTVTVTVTVIIINFTDLLRVAHNSKHWKTSGPHMIIYRIKRWRVRKLNI